MAIISSASGGLPGNPYNHGDTAHGKAKGHGDREQTRASDGNPRHGTADGNGTGAVLRLLGLSLLGVEAANTETAGTRGPLPKQQRVLHLTDSSTTDLPHYYPNAFSIKATCPILAPLPVRDSP